MCFIQILCCRLIGTFSKNLDDIISVEAELVGVLGVVGVQSSALGGPGFGSGGRFGSTGSRNRLHLLRLPALQPEDDTQGLETHDAYREAASQSANQAAVSHPAAPCSGTSMKPMSACCCGRWSLWRGLWWRGRLGCSMLDCCLSREPLEEEEPPLLAPPPLEEGAAETGSVNRGTQESFRCLSEWCSGT